MEEKKMKTFMDKDFLLQTETAKKLYNDYAAATPILDYHCHINPQEIYDDRQFENTHRYGSAATIINGVSCVPAAWTSASLQATLPTRRNS